jgi:mannitol-specific phosphotransferase system IIBC component
VEGHRRKVVGVSVASVAALIAKMSPLIVGSVLSAYVAWWLYRHARSKKS